MCQFWKCQLLVQHSRQNNCSQSINKLNISTALQRLTTGTLSLRADTPNGLQQGNTLPEIK
jgi:hypothetical protein